MRETGFNEVSTAGHWVSAVTFVRSQFDRGTLPCQQLRVRLPCAVTRCRQAGSPTGARPPEALGLPTAPRSPPPLPSLPSAFRPAGPPRCLS